MSYEEYAVIHKCWAYVRPDKRKNINATKIIILEEYETRPEDMPEETAAAIFAKLQP